VGHPGDGVTHRWADWAPCLPGKSQGSLNNESWSDVSDRIDGWWNQNFHRRISESGPWSHEQSNTKSNSNTKTFHEEGSQNPSRVHVSLDNADTVIEGGPAYRFPLTLEGAPSKLRLGGGCLRGPARLADSIHRVPLCEHSASHPFRTRRERMGHHLHCWCQRDQNPSLGHSPSGDEVFQVSGSARKTRRESRKPLSSGLMLR